VCVFVLVGASFSLTGKWNGVFKFALAKKTTPFVRAAAPDIKTSSRALHFITPE